MSIPNTVALLLGEAAEAAASRLGVQMAIALADTEGNLQFFIRMDRALPASTEIAISKAYSAAALRMETSEIGKLALPGEPLYGIDRTHGGKIILFGGGIPLSVCGKVVGAIGISGGTVEEDEQVAAAVVKAFDEMVEMAEQIRPCLGDVAGGRKPSPFLGKCLLEALRSIPIPPAMTRLLTGSVLLAVQKCSC